MFKYILDQVGDNISWMAIIPMVLFMIIFVISIVHIMTRPKSQIDKLSNLPFEDGSSNNSETNAS